ncbi:MAG: hypothetical protein H6747_02305 [Deltaproteobacteria bacterium]|nr:hypothetical protein [Deltaproteobacteria bacterium]
MSRAVVGRYAGKLDWSDAVARNRAAAAGAIEGGPAHILLFEPAHAVLSLGRRSWRAGLDDDLRPLAEARGLAIHDDDRGGRATLHLPGQLVALLALPIARVALGAQIDRLLDAIAATAARHTDAGIVLRQGDDLGLWIGDAKLASVGMRHRDGVAWHGVALNVAIEADAGRGLRLCGRETERLASLLNPAARPSIPTIAAELLSVLSAVVAAPLGAPSDPNPR